MPKVTRKRRGVLSDPCDLAALVLETPGLADKLGDAVIDAMIKLEIPLSNEDAQSTRDIIKTTLIKMAPGWALDVASGEPCKVG